jgi:hypothetical protein
VSVGKAGKKTKLAGNVRREKIEEGGNPDIRNWQAWSRWAQISISFVNTPFQAFGRQPA